MREPLTVAVAQPRCVPYDVAANVAIHAAVIREAGARLVVFPELSLTGYELDAPAIAADDPRLVPIVEACADTGAVALVGAPLQGEGVANIAMLAVDGRSASVAYRKVWVDASEACFAPGDGPARLDIDGWRLGLAICRDTGIAQHHADTAALGIDAYVAGTLMHVDETDIQDGRARRIATGHGVWVVFASFAGSTGGGYADAAGASGIWAPDGTPVDQAGREPGAIARATLTPATSREPAAP